jgi:ABC-type multidrug transport system permease subunit
VTILAGAKPIFLREMLQFGMKLVRPTYVLSAMITPLFYMLVFGMGLGRQVRVDGGDYLSFLVPGLIGMAAMNNSFNWVASSINFARFYYRTWQIVMLSPVSPLAVVVGHVASGVARGLIAIVLIAAAGMVAGWRPEITLVLPISLLLEMGIFAAFGVIIGLKTKKSEDFNFYTNFLITPMGFFCGTFFPLSNLPSWLAAPIHLLPLTWVNIALRQPAFTGDAAMALGALAVFAFLMLLWACRTVANYQE